MLTPSALAWALYRCGARFDKIGLKLTLVEHWLATFIVTSKFGLVVDQNQHNKSTCRRYHVKFWRVYLLILS